MIRAKPESIETYLKVSRFSRRELQSLYRGFKSECPTGVVKEETFKAIYAAFFPKECDTDAYASLVYAWMQRRSLPASSAGAVGSSLSAGSTSGGGSSQHVTFTDLVLTLSCLARGSQEEQLRSLFSLYDVDRDGLLSKADLHRVTLSVYLMLGRGSAAASDRMAREQADRLVRAFNGGSEDEYVTQSAFLDSCRRDPRITDGLALFDTVF